MYNLRSSYLDKQNRKLWTLTSTHSLVYTNKPVSKKITMLTRTNEREDTQFIGNFYFRCSFNFNKIGNNRKWHIHARQKFLLDDNIIEWGKKGINCVRWSLFCTSIDSIQDDVLSLKSTIKFRPNSKIIMWSGVRVATQSTNGIQRIGSSGKKRIIPSTRNRYLIGSIEFRSLLLLISIENHWHNNDFNRYFASFIRFFLFRPTHGTNTIFKHFDVLI